LLRLVGRSADVVRADDSRQSKKLGLEYARAAGWLGEEDVEARAQILFADRPDERLLVDDLGAGCVDEERAGLHRREELLVGEISGFRLQRDVDRDGAGGGRGRPRG